jgi:hypothetical protein
LVLAYAYVVASLFLTIFSFSARTILHCFLLDEENGGSRDTPECLKKFIDDFDESKGQDKEEDGGKTGKDFNDANNMG